MGVTLKIYPPVHLAYKFNTITLCKSLVGGLSILNAHVRRSVGALPTHAKLCWLTS